MGLFEELVLLEEEFGSWIYSSLQKSCGRGSRAHSIVESVAC